jgi:hypothetical protein
LDPLYYDYTQVPTQVADQAFAEFLSDTINNDLLDLPEVLIRHCNRWCEQQRAFSAEDTRVAAILKMQAYLHEKYPAEFSRLMQSNISKFQQRQQEGDAGLYDRRN